MTVFEVRHALLQMHRNDTSAFNIANGFVQDNEQRLVIYRDAFQESQQAGDTQSIASVAVDKAEQRWAVVGVGLSAD